MKVVPQTSRFDHRGIGTFQIGRDSNAAKIKKILTLAATYNPASMATNTSTSTTLTVSGAAIGDVCSAGFSVAVPAGVYLTADVTATDTVTVKLFNQTAGTVDLASGTIRVVVMKF